MDSITLPAYAKLNLTLDILRKRSDGYHDLKMVMQQITLYDDVTVTLADDMNIVCRCAALPEGETNLAVKAALAFFNETGTPPHGISIDIHKRIPMQAGLGGGSADAAATLHAMRMLLRPDMPPLELERVGATVGSDVPFCVHGGTALAEGRGERVTSLRGAPKLYTVVVKPDFSIPTPALFARVRVQELWGRPDTAGMQAAIHRGDVEGMMIRVKNVFESVLPPEYMGVFDIKKRLREVGAEAAAMTGSGSAVFGLFREESAAQAAYETLKSEYEDTFLAQFV